MKDGVTFKYPSDIEIGDNCVIGEFCYLVGKGGLKIGNDVLIGS
ncbi:MAG: acyltransferase, partial [Candidatus Omnitrophica bacterium]|nr:acyltransferase [Candidatus Omnitrophota bacterium]